MLALTRDTFSDDTATTIFTLPDGREITVKVIQVKGQRVRIGFDAPPEIRIRRGELPRVKAA